LSAFGISVQRPRSVRVQTVDFGQKCQNAVIVCDCQYMMQCGADLRQAPHEIVHVTLILATQHGVQTQQKYMSSTRKQILATQHGVQTQKMQAANVRQIKKTQKCECQCDAKRCKFAGSFTRECARHADPRDSTRSSTKKKTYMSSTRRQILATQHGSQQTKKHVVHVKADPTDSTRSSKTKKYMSHVVHVRQILKTRSV
jgi:hypothetical protein